MNNLKRICLILVTIFSPISITETFALEANNSFSSWLHERPEFLDLHWQFKASSCEVVISGEPLPSAIRFRVVDKTALSLTVQFLGSDTLEENEGFAIYQAL